MNGVTKWFMKRALLQTVFEATRVLCMVGGLVILVSGVFFFVLSLLALSLVATVISGRVKHLLWSAIIGVVESSPTSSTEAGPSGATDPFS